MFVTLKIVPLRPPFWLHISQPAIGITFVFCLFVCLLFSINSNWKGNSMVGPYLGRLFGLPVITSLSVSLWLDVGARRLACSQTFTAYLNGPGLWVTNDHNITVGRHDLHRVCDRTSSNENTVVKRSFTLNPLYNRPKNKGKCLLLRQNTSI